jgi:hypothetical protein
VKDGWTRIKHWPPNYGQMHRSGPEKPHAKILLWPSYGRASKARDNRAAFEFAFDAMMSEGKWFIVINEMRYFVEQMKMREMMDEILNEARSVDLTMIMESQGTTWVSRAMIEQETWFIAFRGRHQEAREDIASAMGSKAEFMPDLEELDHHEFVIVNLKTGDKYLSRLPAGIGGP